MTQEPETPERLTELYKSMPTEELAKQGREHLANDAVTRTRRAAHWMRLVAIAVLGGALVVGSCFIGYALLMAKHSGQDFATVRAAAMSGYEPVPEDDAGAHAPVPAPTSATSGH